MSHMLPGFSRKNVHFINNYLRGQDEGGGGQKMSAFVQAQRIKIVHAEGWVKKRQNSVQIVVECPLSYFGNKYGGITILKEAPNNNFHRYSIMISNKIQ